jgi:cytochrome c2
LAKIDEQISYNWLFFLLASAFGAVTFWAVYDEAVTRREYKGYQETFFDIETKLAEKSWKDAKAKLEADPKYRSLTQEKQKVDEEVRGKAAEIKATEAEAKEAEFEAKDRTQNYTFTKSILDEEYYYLTLAKHGISPETAKDSEAYHKLEKQQAKYNQLEKELKDAEKVANEANAKWEAIKQKLASFTARQKQLAKEIEDMERPIAELGRKYQAASERRGGLFGPATEIIQQNLEELGRVDRCESCHVGSNRGGFEKVSPAYFRSHPYRRTLFALHPVEKFGCTTCHDGQGRATTKFYAHAPTDNHHYFEKHFWEYPLLRGPFMEAECRQCHREQVDLRSTLKCESDDECPQNLKCAPLAAALNPASHLNASIEAKPEEGKFCGTPNGADPDKVDVALVDLAPHLSRGRKIIEEVACYGCHPMDGYENKPKAGPDLRHVAAKLNVGWMVEWIKNPKSIRPKTRMPNFFPEGLHPEEYPPTARPNYVDGDVQMGKVSEQEPERRKRALDLLPVERFQPEQQVVLISSFLMANSMPFELPALPPGGDAARGEKLVDTLGCYGCHTLTKPGEKEAVDHKNRASHYDHGPDLGNVGSKTTAQWIYAWIKNPKAYAPKTRMPNLRLSDQEAADIAVFLAGNKYINGQPKEYPTSVAGVDPNNADKQYLGRKLLNYYGCYGCHYVGGFEQTPGIGADLSDFGVKDVARLDYGDYIVKHTQQTWASWIENKLKHPRVYRYERVETRMPQFDLTPDEITDVMVVLKGMRGKTRDSEVRGHRLTAMEQAREKGRELVRFYNCYGCHTVDGFTGDIRQMAQFQDDNARFAPPVINGEGGKTQPSWLFGFLKAPSKLRQSLAVRMPTFGFTDEEATTLVQMFSAFDGAEFPYHDYSNITLDANRRVMAESTFKAAQCLNCHALTDQLTPDQAAIGAPNLLLAKHRLRGEWLLRWLHDPQVLAPGVNMPSFFTNGNPLATAGTPGSPFANLPGIADVAKLDGDGVVTLLRDFLMNVEAPSPKQATH